MQCPYLQGRRSAQGDERAFRGCVVEYSHCGHIVIAGDEHFKCPCLNCSDPQSLHSNPTPLASD
jgi:hypothetical protein